MNDRTNQVIVSVVVVILIIGAWYMGRTQPNVPTEETVSSVDDAEDVLADSDATSGMDISTSVSSANGESISVADQPAGSVVRIASVSLTETGWVAVRDSKGWVLGAGRLEAGSHKSVSVTLLRSTVAGETYQVLLYSDDGDKAYDLHKDSLVMNADASVVGMMFTAQ